MNLLRAAGNALRRFRPSPSAAIVAAAVLAMNVSIAAASELDLADSRDRH